MQLHQLQEHFGSELQVIAVPCNQFGHQENGNKQEIITSLFHIRPGKEYVPNFPLSAKLEVNGAQAHALFRQLRHALPCPSDRDFDTEASSPHGVLSDPLKVLWKPLSRTDISWNFEVSRPFQFERTHVYLIDDAMLEISHWKRWRAGKTI